MKCRKCNTEVENGVALFPSIVHSDDFGGDAGEYGTTINEGPANAGPIVNLKKCLKCPKCGHSFTKKEKDNGKEKE